MLDFALPGGKSRWMLSSYREPFAIRTLFSYRKSGDSGLDVSGSGVGGNNLFAFKNDFGQVRADSGSLTCTVKNGVFVQSLVDEPTSDNATS